MKIAKANLYAMDADIDFVSFSDTMLRIADELEFEKAIDSAIDIANKDALTGVKNKHAYSEWEEKIDVAIRKGEQQPFAVAVCDVNGLKMVNDLYGHKEGDACIKRSCARICRVS